MSTVEPGTVGMMLESGQVVETVSGRHTTPFPTFRSLDTDRKAVAAIRKVEMWLMSNAHAEATARGFMLCAPLAGPWSTADKDIAEAVLFDPATLAFSPRRSILKPLVGAS